jgi:hypothetical protein
MNPIMYDSKLAVADREHFIKATKELIHSVCDDDYTMFKKLIRLGGDINCDIDYYTSFSTVLKRKVPFYTVGGMSERRRPTSILALSSSLKHSHITRYCVKQRGETLFRPLTSEDMLWVIEHSTVRNFAIICSGFGDSFVNGIICFERVSPVAFDDGELIEPETETVRTSVTCVMIDSMRIWSDVDSFYDTVSPTKQATQVRKLMYLIKTGGKLDWAGGVDSSGMSLMCTLITENESYAIDMLLNWKVLTCKTNESIVYIDHCIDLNHKAVLKRLLREPSMDLVSNQYPQKALISQSWISNITPLNAVKMTEIILRHNYVFDHTCVHIVNVNDTTKRITQLYNAGANIADSNSILNLTCDLDFTHPGLDAHGVQSIIAQCQSPRSLVSIARNGFKRSIGPCKTGHIQLKVDLFDIPYGVKKYIIDV